jgi:hypothetical protein
MARCTRSGDSRLRIGEALNRRIPWERMTLNKFWRVLVTLICIGTIMALPQGAPAGGDPAGSGTSALEAWMRAGDKPPSFTLYPEGWDRGGPAVLVR